MKYLQDGKMFSMPEDAPTTIEERLQRLDDQFKVRECLAQYTYYCDHCDPVGAASCFTKTARICWGAEYPVVEGEDAILAHFSEIWSSGCPISLSHLTFNNQVWFKCPDCAVLYSCLHAWKRFEGQSDDYYCYSRYELELHREDGEWRIDSMMFIQAGEIGGDRLGEYFDRPWPIEAIPRTIE